MGDTTAGMGTAVSDVARHHTLSQFLLELVKFAVGSAIDGSRKIIPGWFFFPFPFPSPSSPKHLHHVSESPLITVPFWLNIQKEKWVFLFFLLYNFVVDLLINKYLDFNLLKRFLRVSPYWSKVHKGYLMYIKVLKLFQFAIISPRVHLPYGGPLCDHLSFYD